MIRARVYVRRSHREQWTAREAEFVRLPVQNEYITFEEGGDLYAVTFVVHHAHASGETYAADVYAMNVPRRNVLGR